MNPVELLILGAARELDIRLRGSVWQNTLLEHRLGRETAKAAAVAAWMVAHVCRRPPAGWTCSRENGHPGPCAAERAIVS